MRATFTPDDRQRISELATEEWPKLDRWGSFRSFPSEPQHGRLWRLFHRRKPIDDGWAEQMEREAEIEF